MKSVLKLHEEEEKSKSALLKRKRPFRSREAAEELRDLNVAIASGAVLIEQMISNDDPSGTVAGTDLQFRDKSRIYHRDLNSSQKLFETGAAVVGALKEGIVIESPQVPHPPLQCPEKRPEKTSAGSRKLTAKQEAEATSRNALSIGAKRKEVDIHPDEFGHVRNIEAKREAFHLFQILQKQTLLYRMEVVG